MRITSKEYKDAQLNLNKIMSDIADHMEIKPNDYLKLSDEDKQKLINTPLQQYSDKKCKIPIETREGMYDVYTAEDI